MVGRLQDSPPPGAAPLPEPTQRLSLPLDRPLAEAIVGALSGVVAYAHECAVTAEDAPGFAVHEFRKSVRRVRAMCRLIADLAGADAVADAQAILRAAQSATSTQRDTDVLPHVLRRLPLPPVVGASVALRLFTGKHTPADLAPPALILRDHAAAMLELPAALGAAMPGRVRWRDVAGGIEHTYGKARRALDRSKRDEDQLHRWRKRNKELVYQLELLAVPGAKPVRTLRKSHAALSERLGAIVDMMVVRDRLARFTDAPAQEAVEVVEAEIRRAIKAARKRGKNLYRASPRRFSGRVAKAARAARKSAKTS